MEKIKKLVRALIAPLINDPSYHYYYAEPVDKRGSTTYPPEDSGPSDLAIYGTIAIAMFLVCRRAHRRRKIRKEEKAR